MGNTQLAIIDGDELAVIQRTAKLLAASGYFGTERDATIAMAQVATKIMAGRELGFGAFASVNGIHVISGKPAIGANLMASAVKSSGRYDYRVREMTAEKCVIEFFERVGDKRESIGVSEFTKEDADASGTQNMKKFGRNMMFARCMSNGVRWFCPDVFSGNAVYVPEELGAEVDGDGNVVDAKFTLTPPPEPTQKPVERTVDTATGEISDMERDVALWKTNAGKPPVDVLSETQFNRLHSLGRELYGDEEVWDKERKRLVEHVSKGAISSSKELSTQEADKLIGGIQKKLAELKQPVANGVAA